jgi:hypothetical protein
MATTLISNGAVAGALAALMNGRAETSNAATPTGEATNMATIADAIRDQFLTANAALTAPMADADNANIFMITFAAVYGQLSGRAPRSTTAADYAAAMAVAASFAKAGAAQLV